VNLERKGNENSAVQNHHCARQRPSGHCGQPGHVPTRQRGPGCGRAAGNAASHAGARTETYGPTDTGIACGSGAGAFDIFDQGTHNQHAIRFYNTDGNLTKRVIYDQYFSQFTNPLTGAAIPYTQHNTTTDILAVPGDFTSATETTTGQANITVPHMGAVVLNAGRVVFGADGTLEFSAGPQDFLDYFYNGNAAAVAELCTALGAS